MANICMFDLETYSTDPNAAIASIGAVVADSITGVFGETFYINVSPADSKSLGLHFSEDTLDWWKKQPSEVIKAITIDPKPVKESLESFFDFYKRNKCEQLWAWGNSFDAPILVSSRIASGARREPWKYWESKCARTFCDEFGIKPERIEGQHHNSMEDAIAQMKVLIQLKLDLKALTE